MILLKAPCGCYEEIWCGISGSVGQSSGRCAAHKGVPMESPKLVDAISDAVRRLGVGLGLIKCDEEKITK